MIDTLTTTARHPTASDRLTGDLPLMPRPDFEWVWLVEGPEGIAGYFVCAPCHGIVLVVRAIKMSGTPHNWLLCAIRQAIKECHARGYTAWITPIVIESDVDGKVVKVATKFGANATDVRPTSLIGGSLCRS